MGSSKVRHALETMLTILMFTLQNIVYGGWSISIMFIPLFAYLISLETAHPNLERDFNVLLFAKEFMVGRVIASIGFIILLIAGIQLLKAYVEHAGLVKTGLYSVVRHPQYMGITIITLGLTVMVLTLAGNVSQPIFMWLMQILGYITLARYEEWHLNKKYGENYHQYRRGVPFMYPLKCPSKIPETLFTIVVSVAISLILLLFPYDIIRFL